MDVEQVRDFLSRRVGPDVTDVERIDAGAWSEAVGFRHAGRALIVRFSRVEDDFRNDARAARFASSELPIPAVHEIGEALGGWYAISDRAEGDYLEGANEPLMRARLPSVFAPLDAMRVADVTASQGFGRWMPDGNGAHPSWRATLLDVAADRPGLRIHGWQERLAQHPDVARVFDHAYRELERVADDPSRRPPRRPQRPVEPQRPRRGGTDHGGSRLGLRPVRRLPVRSRVVRRLGALVRGVVPDRRPRRGAA